MGVCSVLVSKFSHFSLFHPPLFILYSTALFCTVLYKKRRMKEGKMRKFAYKHKTDNQTVQRLRPLKSSVDTRGSWPINVSNTETTLILCGYWRELANYHSDNFINKLQVWPYTVLYCTLLYCTV